MNPADSSPPSSLRNLEEIQKSPKNSEKNSEKFLMRTLENFANDSEITKILNLILKTILNSKDV